MSSMPVQQLFASRLKERRLVAIDTLALYFEKPAALSFKAGQFIEMTLIDPVETDAKGNARAFSIASAPHEETLMVATRMRNTAFKRSLEVIPLEQEVKIEGPFGNLTLHNNAARPAVLLAGGIGVTPFRSIVLRAARDKLAHRVFLFYSNRRPEDAPFLEELQSLERQNPNYKLIATMTQMRLSNRSWHGETGMINKEMLARSLTGLRSPIYYLAGPPGMVGELRNMLNCIGIDDDDIRSEEFAGY